MDAILNADAEVLSTPEPLERPLTDPTTESYHVTSAKHISLDRWNVRDSTDHNFAQVTPLQKMLSACVGAFLTSVFTTPLDVVKTRLQSQSLFKNAKISAHNVSSYSAVPRCCRNVFFTAHDLRPELMCRFDASRAANQASTLSCCSNVDTSAGSQTRSRQVHVRQLKGPVDGVFTIVRYEGVTSLWRGLSPALVMSAPATVIYFVGYDYLKDILKLRWQGNHLEIYAPLAAGALARTIAATVISPIELFRTRMQGPEGSQGTRRVLAGIHRMVQTHGPSSLWRGLSPTLWRDVPFSAIYWMEYEIIKQWLSNYVQQNQLSSKFNEVDIAFISGATSGMIAATLTTPFDVAKTRQQVALNSMSNPSIVKTMQMVIQEEGYRGLMRGLVLRVSKAVPACAIMISSYEAGKAFFQNHGKRARVADQLNSRGE